jgi:hypothetical protein
MLSCALILYYFDCDLLAGGDEKSPVNYAEGSFSEDFKHLIKLIDALVLKVRLHLCV